MPSLLKHHLTQQATFKQSLNAYLKSRGFTNAERVWTKMYDTIRQVFFAKIAEIRPLIGKYKYPW